CEIFKCKAENPLWTLEDTRKLIDYRLSLREQVECLNEHSGAKKAPQQSQKEKN
ncbi:hypothetical protein AAVH_43510, partial [Aphelenchoides avenae]